MSEFSFEWLGTGSLATALKQPIRSISISVGHQGTAFALKLWHEDGAALEIYSKMHDIAFREEVGVLSFEPTKSSSPDDQLFQMPGEFLHIVDVIKLTINEPGVGVIESGISLILNSRREFTVVSGNFPCSLAIDSVPGLPIQFDPEYAIEKYTRSRM